MLKFKPFLFATYLLLNTAYIATPCAKEPPILVDLIVTGSMDTPSFEPLQLTFNTNQEYVLVITNDKPYSILFYYEKFGQQVATYLLQGVPNVSQESMTLMPTSKVTWHFTAQHEGQFKFYASIPGANQSGKAGEILVKNLAVSTPNTSPTTQEWITAQTPEKQAAQPQKPTLFSFFKKTKIAWRHIF